MCERGETETEYSIWILHMRESMWHLSSASELFKLTSCSPIHLEHGHAHLFVYSLWKTPNIYFWSFLGPVIFFGGGNQGSPIFKWAIKENKQSHKWKSCFYMANWWEQWCCLCKARDSCHFVSSEDKRVYSVFNGGMELNLLKRFGGRPWQA